MEFYENYLKLCNRIDKAPSRVAEDLGLSRSMVTKWKSGGGITDVVAERVAAYFGITINELMHSPTQSKRLTDEEVELEIERLKKSEYVKLGKKEERIRLRRRQYMYCLRNYEKKGKELAAAGITLEMLDCMADEELEA